MSSSDQSIPSPEPVKLNYVFPVVPDMSHLFRSLNTFQEMAQKVIDAYAKPLRRALDVFNQHLKKLMEPLWRILDKFALLLHHAFNWKPLIYVTPPAEQHNNYLQADVNRHGYFIFGTTTIFKLHSRTSRSGRFLHKLLMCASEVVTYEEIENHIGSGDRVKAFKDLKYKLKQEGYEIDYTLVRSEGIALNGIIAI